MGRLFWKTRADTAPSLHRIGRLQLSVLIKNGRCWRKRLSMSVSPGRSSKDTSLLAMPLRHGRWQPQRKAVKGGKVKRCKRGRPFDGFTLSIVRCLRRAKPLHLSMATLFACISMRAASPMSRRSSVKFIQRLYWRARNAGSDAWFMIVARSRVHSV